MSVLRLLVPKQKAINLSSQGGSPIEVEENSVWYLPVREVSVRGKRIRWVLHMSENPTTSGADIVGSYLIEESPRELNLYITMKAVSDRYGEEEWEYKLSVLLTDSLSNFPSVSTLHEDRKILLNIRSESITKEEG